MNVAPDQVKEDIRFRIVRSLDIGQRGGSITELLICEEVCYEDFPLLQIGVQEYLDCEAKI